jgi:hypothetical protein
MKLKVQQGGIQESTADTIIVNLFDDVTTPAGATGAVDEAVGGAISELIASGDLSGKAGEVGVLYPRGAIPARRVLVAGLGERDEFDLEGIRVAAAYAGHADSGFGVTGRYTKVSPEELRVAHERLFFDRPEDASDPSVPLRLFRRVLPAAAGPVEFAAA